MIPVVDLFAGPGGLAEGFSSAASRGRAPFEVIVSAEMEPSAHKTLRLRSFFRSLVRGGAATDSYYEYVMGHSESPYDSRNEKHWKHAHEEALNLELGKPADDTALDKAVRARIDSRKPWVLIGGPPCQAYSLVGRSRNAGIKNYKAELDKRFTLYQEYLRVLANFGPAVFVMENVKGLLSSKLKGGRIFHQMLRDLANPGAALKKRASEYVIHSLVAPISFREGDDPEELDARSFVVECEKYGVPQRRHRVILLGVRRDYAGARIPVLREASKPSMLPRAEN